MSKELEALENIRRILEEAYHFPLNLTNEYKIINEALIRLEELEKRDVPMKLIEDSYYSSKELYCPMCGEVIEDNILDENNFCHVCGQRLERGKENE